jgi:hypothetical protein
MSLSKIFAPASTAVLAFAVGATGCSMIEGPEPEATDNDPPLQSLEATFDGTPENHEVPRELGKFDDILSVRHDDLVPLVSPVRNQARRGVCSIFSTIGLMEHLYIAEGTITDPDFSEQYLQWSAKFEVNSFPTSSGSNDFYNLQAINRFGIVDEATWPYESDQWGTFDDPECDGEDDQPTRCYTNGHPTDEVKAAPKFDLPPGRFLNTFDIKGHIASTNTGVVVGLTFFYQAWNHRKSPLPTNAGNWDAGFVLYPNSEDKTESRAEGMSAGHSILIVGWDESLEVPVRDAEGNVVTDANGEPVVEKGFYLFKNSWGTVGFGIDHEMGPGWGWISKRYVNEYGRARIAGLPTDVRPDDMGSRDVSLDGPGFSIPDNDFSGNSASVTTGETGTIKTLTVEVDISHTFRGDLIVELERDGSTAVLQRNQGGGADDLVATFTVNDFNDEDFAGTWNLVVRDTARIDIGQVNSWKLTGSLD